MSSFLEAEFSRRRGRQEAGCDREADLGDEYNVCQIAAGLPPGDA
jgi:hypothetical protein